MYVQCTHIFVTPSDTGSSILRLLQKRFSQGQYCAGQRGFIPSAIVRSQVHNERSDVVGGRRRVPWLDQLSHAATTRQRRSTHLNTGAGGNAGRKHFIP